MSLSVGKAGLFSKKFNLMICKTRAATGAQKIQKFLDRTFEISPVWTDKPERPLRALPFVLATDLSSRHVEFIAEMIAKTS